MTSDDAAAQEKVQDHLGRLKLDDVDWGWGLLPPEVQDLILAHLPLLELFRLSIVCKSFWKVIERGTFHQLRARLRCTECSLSPLVFYAEKDSWHVRGFDSEDDIWRKLPPFKAPIPAPDPDLFKDFHVAGGVGLFAVNVGKANEAEKLYVVNPLTGASRKLPALEFSRHPVIINVHVTLAKKNNSITSSFQVIVVGSAAIGTESLSRKTDVYESEQGTWLPAGDVPGTDFSLNDYSNGAYCESQNLLLCVGFMVNGSKGILAFDVVKRKWRDNWICPFFEPDPITDTALTVYFAISQILVLNNVVYLFSEQEAGRNVTHCIDRLDLEDGGGFKWTRVVTRQRQGNRALLVYPEYTCVPLGQHRLCIFNTIERTGVIYDMSNVNLQATETSITPPPIENGIMFHSLNPVGYAFEPSFGVSVEDKGGPSKNTVKDEPEDMGGPSVKDEPQESHKKPLTK